jgi:hypothetical protein
MSLRRSIHFWRLPPQQSPRPSQSQSGGGEGQALLRCCYDARNHQYFPTRAAAALVEHYQQQNALKTDSQVVEQALYLLREQSLELQYQQGSLENDPACDVTVADGLDEPY